MSSEDCGAGAKHPPVSNANNHLAVHMYKLLAKEQTNVFFSPFSISTALAMLFCGSAHETAAEMRQVLGYEAANIDDPDIKAHFQQLLEEVEKAAEGYTLSCANSVVSDKEFSVKDDYKSLLKESFKALLKEVDFVNEAGNAVGEINDWVNEKTNSMIPKVLDSLDPSTVMVLLNAVYFKGLWEKQFDKESTFQQNFYNKGIEANAKQVDMMHMKKKFPYFESESFKALQLPYKGGDVSMVILLPKSEDGLKDVEAGISSTFVHDLVLKMHKTKVDVALPKFKLEYSKSLKEQFESLGMSRIFRAGAHFDGISDSKQLLISEIIHKAVVEVNEEGSEAAAVTAVVMMMCSLSFDPEFIVDHPFMFVIYDSKSNLILFMGRVEEL